MSDQTATARFELPGFEGELFHPDDEGYDEARRVFNGMIDRRPALIARCASADDVVLAVGLARDNDLPLSVYGGGHGVTGSAVVDAGICVDLRGLKRIDVDPETRTARAEGGLTWREFDAATQEHGLAVTGGRVGDTGIAGLALGSGSGWLERSIGYTCDSLAAAEVVTADGRKVRASEDENPELFWGLRGGGGNFGIVTAFHFRLHEVGPIVLGGMLMYPAELAGELVRFYRDFMLAAPNEVGTGLAFISAPPADFIPEPVRGKPVVGVVVCCTGPVEEAAELMRPLREFGPPALDIVQPMPYVAVQQLLEPGNQKGMQNYWTADFLDELPDEAIDALVALATQPVSPLGQVILVPGGGAIEHVDEDAMAFGQRRAPWNIHFLSMWADPADTETNIAYTRELAAAVKPWASGRAYLNFIGDEGLGRVEAAFGTEKYRRLQALKDEWDPHNLFRHNQNIPPTAG
ncbi:MAG: FAD-binding oxidoreductase [Thermoleophilaceae bacterium]|nr:FAD-binding oxidoreductase [Thermoleophilaceae bacterium]